MPGTAPATSVAVPTEGHISPSRSCLLPPSEAAGHGGQLQVARAAAQPRCPLQEGEQDLSHLAAATPRCHYWDEKQ